MGAPPPTEEAATVPDIVALWPSAAACSLVLGRSLIRRRRIAAADSESDARLPRGHPAVWQ
jgi:hypothetical protein